MTWTRGVGYTPTHPCESNTEIPEFDGNNTSCCSDRGVVCHEKTPELRHCVMNARVIR